MAPVLGYWKIRGVSYRPVIFKCCIFLIVLVIRENVDYILDVHGRLANPYVIYLVYFSSVLIDSKSNVLFSFIIYNQGISYRMKYVNLLSLKYVI